MRQGQRPGLSYSGGDYTGDALYFAAEGGRYPRSQYKDTLPEDVGVDQLEANIAGGTFTSANGAGIAAYVDPLRNDAVALTNFVSGGLYSSEPAAALLAPKHFTKTVSDPAGYYTVYRWLVGSGTAQDPFQIADREDLEFFRDQVNNANALGTAGQHFLQLADIDLGGDRWVDIGNVNDNAACFVSLPAFSGVYDGGGHTVSNFVLSGYSYCGFFGAISDGTVKNLRVLDARSPDTYVAGTPTTHFSAGAVFCGEIGGLGAVNHATFRYLNPSTMKYVDHSFDEQMEITNLTGNISQKDGKPYLHVHITASRSDYSCIGGHLLDARINGACELFVTAFPGTFAGRRPDAETGINLYEF